MMSQKTDGDHSADSQHSANGDELAARVFTITMVGVFAAILLMVILGDW